MSVLFSRHQLNSLLGLNGLAAQQRANLLLEHGAKNPEAKQLVPFQDQSISSNQQSVPLPFLGGTRLMAVRWASDALDIINHEVPSSQKKS